MYIENMKLCTQDKNYRFSMLDPGVMLSMGQQDRLVDQMKRRHVDDKNFNIKKHH